MQQKAVDNDPKLKFLDWYNDAIQELCEQENVECVDITGLAEDSLYEPDGEHFIMDFYPLWAERLLEAADL